MERHDIAGIGGVASDLSHPQVALARRLGDRVAPLLSNASADRFTLAEAMRRELHDAESWTDAEDPGAVAARRTWESFVARHEAEWHAFLIGTLEAMARGDEDRVDRDEDWFLFQEVVALAAALPEGRREDLSASMRAAVGHWPWVNPEHRPAARSFMSGVLASWSSLVSPARAREVLLTKRFGREEGFALLDRAHEEGVPIDTLLAVLYTLDTCEGDGPWALFQYLPSDPPTVTRPPFLVQRQC